MGNGALSVTDSVIRENVAENGAGLYLAANGASSTLLQDVTFRSNRANAKGGALYSNGTVKLAGRVWMQYSGASGNSAGERGNGAYP